MIIVVFIEINNIFSTNKQSKISRRNSHFFWSLRNCRNKLVRRSSSARLLLGLRELRPLLGLRLWRELLRRLLDGLPGDLLLDRLLLRF